MGLRKWLKGQLVDILELRPPTLSHVGGIGLGTVVRSPEEAAKLNYNQAKPLAHIQLRGSAWRCPANHRNEATGTGYANCPQCCRPVHLDHPKETAHE